MSMLWAVHYAHTPAYSVTVSLAPARWHAVDRSLLDLVTHRALGFYSSHLHDLFTKFGVSRQNGRASGNDGHGPADQP